MRKQYFQLPDHIRVTNPRHGIVEADVDEYSEELLDRMRVMQHRLAEELELPIELVADRLEGVLHELSVISVFKGTKMVAKGTDYCGIPLD